MQITEPIMWCRHPGGLIDNTVVHYTARVRNTFYQIDHDAPYWILWIKEKSDDTFYLWGSYRTLKEAKDQVVMLETNGTTIEPCCEQHSARTERTPNP